MNNETSFRESHSGHAFLNECPTHELLDGLLVGGLDEDQLLGIENHVEACANCQDRLAQRSMGKPIGHSTCLEGMETPNGQVNLWESERAA